MYNPSPKPSISHAIVIDITYGTNFKFILQNQMSSATEPQTLENAEEIGPYAIYPKDGSNKAQTDAIKKLLSDLIPDRQEGIYCSESPYLGVSFWSARLTKSQAATVEANPNASSIASDPLTCGY